MEKLHVLSPIPSASLPAESPDLGREGDTFTAQQGPVKTLVNGACPWGPWASHAQVAQGFRG